MSEIKLHSLSKSFGSVQVLKDFSLTITEGEFLTLFGPNGCGKSTLMNLLTGLDVPSSGSIQGINTKEHNVGVVFQDFRRSLLPWSSALENIYFPLRLRGASEKVCEETLGYILDLIPVSFDLKQRVFTLSGGQAQTVCLIRALMIKPRLLILDEPFSALDYGATLSLRATLSNISAVLGYTTICISHDLEEALLLGDRVVFLSKRPATIVSEVKVSFPKPRDVSIVSTPEFASLKGEALKVVGKIF
jgi:NitT/TauT family transport system ATP-binding protein